MNLSEWKSGGFLDWQARQDMLIHTQELVEEAQDLKAGITGSLTEHLGVIVAGRYAELLNKWNGEVDEGFMKKLKALRLLSQDVGALRRGDVAGDHQAVRAERLKLEREKRLADEKTTQARALEICLEEAKKYPEPAAVFRQAFALLDDYDEGRKQNWEYEQAVRAGRATGRVAEKDE